jgi:hypothetical protein
MSDEATVQCPNCESTDVELVDAYEREFECRACSYQFWEDELEDGVYQ